jgi:serine/threonine-protein kinase
MTPTEWRRIKTLLDDALARPLTERSAFLDAACADAPGLRAEVASLLVAHDHAEAAHALESPFASAASDSRDAEEQVEGQQVGPYRLMRLLGRGGMGSVYLAERADGHYEQTVALKLIRRGLDTDDILSRFAFERQILAGLDHPNIARLHDGGMTADGRPYFAMEYVAGVPITDYCDQHRLATPQRLALFRTVCRAVQHAHQNLVVHRDLKPSNILVTGDGQVKLLDFGIAKLLSDEGFGAGPTIPRTRTGARVLTPEYAAPEQVRGATVTTATDVYQLGVLLYELLTGRRPYRLPSRVQAEVARVILEEEPIRPSTAVRRTEMGDDEAPTTLTPEAVSRARSTDPGRLRRRLAGDLDMICLTALKKEPERRYANVEALAEDVRRHLVGLPVMARPDTFGYRASRFVRRHRTSVAAAVAVVLALVVGLGVAVWQGQQAAVERDRAEAALEQAESTLDFLSTMISAGGPREGDPDMPIGTVLERAAARVDAELADKPEVARAVYTSLASVFFEMGRLDAAQATARQALALFETERGVDYARALHALAMALGFDDSTDAAIRYHEAALSALEGVPDAEAQRAAILNTYAHALVDATREADAEAAYQEALALYQAVDDPDILYTLNGLGVLHLYQGRYDEAVPLLRRAVDRMRRVRPGSYELGEALGNLAGAHAALGQMDDALEARRDALAILEEAVDEEHLSAIIQRTSYASDLLLAGQVAAAQREAQRSLDAAVRAFGARHPYTAFAQNVAGQAHCAGPEPGVGASLLRASLTTRRDVLPEGHWLVANGESLLGGCLATLGRTEEAEAFLTQGYDGLRSSRGPDHQKTVEARERLQAFYAATGQPERAAAPTQGP